MLMKRLFPMQNRSRGASSRLSALSEHSLFETDDLQRKVMGRGDASEQKETGREQEEAVREQREMELLFEHMDELSAEGKSIRQKEHQEQLKKAIDELYKLQKKKHQSLKAWKAILSNEEYEWAIKQDAFLTEMGKTLEGKNISESLYQYLKEQIRLIVQYKQNDSEKSTYKGLISPQTYVDMKIESAYYGSKEMLKEEIWSKVKIVFFCLLVISILVYALKSGRFTEDTKKEVKQESWVLPSELDMEALQQEAEQNIAEWQRLIEEQEKLKQEQ